MTRRPAMDGARRRERSRRADPAPRVTRAQAVALPHAADHPARWSRPHVRTIAIASGRRGAGKSHLAANLAVALGERGARVLLVDADFGAASLDLLLGLHPAFDLQHVVSGEKAIEEVVVPGPRGVTLVPASPGAPDRPVLDDYRREVLLRSIGLLEGDADLILIDTAGADSPEATAFCRPADDVLVVCTTELPDFSDAYGLVKRLHEEHVPSPPHLVVNQAGSGEEAEETAQRIRAFARRFLGAEPDYWGAVPFDPAVPRAGHLQEPVVTAFPQSPAAVAYRALAARLWSDPSPGEWALPDSERLEA